MKLEQMVRSLVKTILEAEQKGTKPYDTTAEVVRVDGETAWVHLTGGIEETPVKMTINVVKGDIVQVRVSGGDAWITGNLTKPPTDDQLAKEAKKHAEIADLRAKKAQQMANKTQEEIDSTAQEFANAIIGINQDIDDLQSQIDGEITSWFYDTDPAMNKPPVTVDPDNPDQTGWDTDEKKQRHVGDTYTNVDSGNSWRWIFYEGEYSWLRISDSDVQRALDLASQAKDTADSKRRVFVSTPTPPYDIGDLWVQGTSGDILRCSTAKITGQSFAQSDWVKASKYTDDTVANQAVTLAQQAQTSANGKNKIYSGSTQPSSASNGDTWFNSAEDNAIYVYNGSSWVKQELGEDAIANLSITNAKIADGTIQNAKIGNLDAGKITSGTIDSNRLNIAQIISVGDIAVEGDIPTKLSQLTNDSSYATTGQVSTAKNEAITTASADATSKANQAESNAIATASADATSKANTAQTNAEATASADATAKANEAKKTATNFLTVITGTTGISVHDVNDTSNYVNIASNLFKIVTGGVERFKAWVENNVAKVRVGTENAGHVEIESDGMNVYGGNNGSTLFAKFGATSEIKSPNSSLKLSANELSMEDSNGNANFKVTSDTSNTRTVTTYRTLSSMPSEGAIIAMLELPYNGATVSSAQWRYQNQSGTLVNQSDYSNQPFYYDINSGTVRVRVGKNASSYVNYPINFYFTLSLPYATAGLQLGRFPDSLEDGAVLKVGVGKDANNKRTAFKVKYNGETRIGGDLYVECDDDSTGGYKLNPTFWNMADGEGLLEFGDVLIEWGVVTITIPTDATTEGDLYIGRGTVSFTYEFKYRPAVMLTWAANYNNQRSVNTYSLSTTGFTAMGRTTTKNTSTAMTRTIRWIAIGQKAEE